MSDAAGAQGFVPPVGSYAVVFWSQRTASDQGYAATAEAMVELAARQPGYLGVRSSSDASGQGLTVSYWSSLEAVAAWRGVLAHQAARDQGRARWYAGYELQVCRVERAYAWQPSDGPQDPRP